MKKRLPEIKRQIQSNGLYKLVALLVSLVIWSTTLTGRVDITNTIDMNIAYDIPSNMELDSQALKNISVKLAGPRTVLKDFSELNHQVYINLRDHTEGKHEIIIRENKLNLPPDLRVISTSPNKVRVTLKRRSEEKHYEN